MAPGALTVRRFSGVEIAPFVPELARLRIAVFREFPYLYDGTAAYEERYLQTYITSPHSIAVIAFDGDVPVGASTGVPLADETDEFREPFERVPGGGANVFYCGESVLERAYRGRGLYPRFFAEREARARELGLTVCAFCAVDRPSDHPRRPAGYRPLDAIWTRLGYSRHAELAATFAWKDVDESGETAKSMVFWLKVLSG